MIHVVSNSTGALSALSLERVINRYGIENVKSVFMDTRYEDSDNYRFLAETDKYLGIETIVLSKGVTPIDVFTRKHLIPSGQAVPCTEELKIWPFQRYLASLLHVDAITVHIGYDYEEMHRCEKTRKNYESIGYSVDFPMLWKPYELRRYTDVLRNEWGIEPPRMYAMGYTHANCGGRCVKQGQGDWLRMLINFPERFAEVEEWETGMRQNEVNAPYAMLKERPGGELLALPLSELRRRYEANPNQRLDKLDEQSSCVVCGIGG